MVAEGAFGRLYMERVRRAASVALERSDPTLGVGMRDARTLIRLDAAEVQAVRERDDVAGEAVAAHVRALPRRVREGSGERARDGAPALGAAGVPAAVGADHEERIDVAGGERARAPADRGTARR